MPDTTVIERHPLAVLTLVDTQRAAPAPAPECTCRPDSTQACPVCRDLLKAEELPF